MYCRRIADNLERYHHDFSAFENDHLFQDACCMCVVQIGELVSQLSDDVKQKNPAVPWRIIKDTRNFYVHAYGAIDVAAVWDTLEHDIVEILGNLLVVPPSVLHHHPCLTVQTF